MTLQQWIDRRELEPPPALAQRLRQAVAAVPADAGSRIPDVALQAALTLLDSLLRMADPSRAGAIALLAADALMTYTFEAAADEPERLESLGAEAMRRIAMVAAELPS